MRWGQRLRDVWPLLSFCARSSWKTHRTGRGPEPRTKLWKPSQHMGSWDLHPSQVPSEIKLLPCHMQELVHKTWSSPSSSKQQPLLPSNAETMLGRRQGPLVCLTSGTQCAQEEAEVCRPGADETRSVLCLSISALSPSPRDLTVSLHRHHTHKQREKGRGVLEQQVRKTAGIFWEK